MPLTFPLLTFSPFYPILISVNIDSNSVVKLEYILHIAAKEITRQTRTILMGHAHDLPAGLESLLIGRSQGEQFTQVVPQAYGGYDPSKVVKASRSDFPAGTVLEVGEQFYNEDEAGTPVAYRIVQVAADHITLDANHEQAGQDLHYQVHILAVRQAEPGELEHGHVHGEGGVRH